MPLDQTPIVEQCAGSRNACVFPDRTVDRHGCSPHEACIARQERVWNR
jgi:hypothetical protein